jgi:hypothetical protein
MLHGEYANTKIGKDITTTQIRSGASLQTKIAGENLDKETGE